MKKLLYIAISLIALNATAQSVAINTDGSAADNSALLDLKSTNQGVLVPRMTAAQRTAIATPATGLMVYQTDAPAGFYFYNGSVWTTLNGATGTNGTNGQGVPTGGTTGQVLAKVDATDFNTQWVTPSSGGSGAQVALIATKTSNAQVLPLANGTNTGDLVTFDNVVTSNATLGSYNTTTNTFTVSQSGVYYIQATVRTPDAPTVNQTVNPFLFVDVDNAGITGLNNIITDYQVANPTNFPLGAKGKGFTSVMFYLTAGQTINIKGLSANSGTLSQGLSTNGSCKFMIFKL